MRGTIQLPRKPFDVDWEACSRLHPAPGVVYVEMQGYEEKKGELYLPDETKQRERADCGVVLACGCERGDDLPPREMEIRPGNTVLVEPYRGTFLKNAQFGDYKAKGWVRVYGLASGSWDEYHPTDWRQAILAVLDEKTTIRATGRWLFVKRDRIEESKGGVLLHDRAQKQSGKGTIVSAGADAQKLGYREGQRIHFPPGLTYDSGMYDVSHAEEFGLDCDDYSFLDSRNVLAVIDG